MSQQIENNSDHLLRPIESNSANRLPLRKRIAPVLKWQPVETPEEHHKQTYPPTSSLQIASPYPVHSISDASDNGIELDEAGQRPKEEQPSSPPNNRVSVYSQTVEKTDNSSVFLFFYSQLRK